MASELQRTVLKGALDGDKKRFFYLVEKVKDEYFSDEYQDLWKIIQRVHDVTRELLDAATLEKVLSRSKLSAERIVKVEDLWRELAATPPVTEVDFRSSVDLVLQDHQTLMLGEALTTSLEILSRGVKDEKTGIVTQGPDEALSHFRSQMAGFEGVNLDVMPEFNIREQELELLAEMHEINTLGRLATGIVPFDEMTNGGLAPGELMLIVAASGVGKSISCTSISQSVMSRGGNVIYFTTETLFKQIRFRSVVAHSRGFIPGGVSSTAIRKHSAEDPHLSEEEILAYTETVKDFSRNENYGKLIVVQIPKGTRLGAVEAKLYRWQQECHLDLCVIDSPDMLAPDVSFGDERHNLNWVINGVKGMAISFNEAKGLPIIAPWQSSRAGQERLATTGRYDKSALADSAQAERRADIIGALVPNAESPTKMGWQTLKNRDSQEKDFLLEADLDHYYIGSEESLSQADSVDIGRLL